jgi:hypothetical protein
MMTSNLQIDGAWRRHGDNFRGLAPGKATIGQLTEWRIEIAFHDEP